MILIPLSDYSLGTHKFMQRKRIINGCVHSLFIWNAWLLVVEWPPNIVCNRHVCKLSTCSLHLCKLLLQITIDFYNTKLRLNVQCCHSTVYLSGGTFFCRSAMFATCFYSYLNFYSANLFKLPLIFCIISACNLINTAQLSANFFTVLIPLFFSPFSFISNIYFICLCFFLLSSWLISFSWHRWRCG